MNDIQTRRVRYAYVMQSDTDDQVAISDTLTQLSETLEVRNFQAGEALLDANDAEAHLMYVLMQGTVEVTLTEDDMPVARYSRSGTALGEVELITGNPREAHVHAVSDVVAVAITRENIRDLTASEPALVQAYLKGVIVPRVRRRYLANVLFELLGDLSTDELRSVEAQLTWLELDRGEVLYHEGAASDEMAIVVTGQLQVRQGSDEAATVLAR
ncbi:MAG: cyclic nucleotide-binding domain-containing protein, partial [Chloroflexota bacterium]